MNDEEATQETPTTASTNFRPLLSSGDATLESDEATQVVPVVHSDIHDNPIVKSFPHLSEDDSYHNSPPKDDEDDEDDDETTKLIRRAPVFASIDASRLNQTVTPYFARGRQHITVFDSPNMDLQDNDHDNDNENHHENDTQPVAKKYMDSGEFSESQSQQAHDRNESDIDNPTQVLTEDHTEDPEESPMFNNGGKVLDLTELEFSQATPGLKGNIQKRQALVSRLRNAQALYEESPLRSSDTPTATKHLHYMSTENSRFITPARPRASRAMFPPSRLDLGNGASDRDENADADTDTDFYTQPVHRDPSMNIISDSTSEVSGGVDTPRTVVKQNRPITQVFGTPYAPDSSTNSSSGDHRSQPNSRLSLRKSLQSLKSGRELISLRHKSTIYENYNDDDHDNVSGEGDGQSHTQEDHAKDASQDTYPVNSQSNDTIVSDPEDSADEEAPKAADETVVSSSEMVSSSPERLYPDNGGTITQHGRKRRLPSSVEDKSQGFEVAIGPGPKVGLEGPELALETAPETAPERGFGRKRRKPSPLKSQLRKTPSPSKSSSTVSPSLTPGHSKVRMTYFDDQQLRTPTKLGKTIKGLGEHEQYEQPDNALDPTSECFEQTSSPPYTETGAWLPWNDGKWYVVKIVKGAPLGVASLFESSNPQNASSSPLCVVDKTETETLVNFDGIKRLHLEIGDKVKCDADKKKVFEIVQLLRVSDDPNVTRCQGGFDGVKLRVFTANRGGGRAGEEEATAVLQANVCDLYMTTTQVKTYILTRKQAVEPFPTQNGKFTGFEEMVSQMTQASRRNKPACNKTYAEDDDDEMDNILKNGGVDRYSSPIKNSEGLFGPPTAAGQRMIFSGCVFTVSSIDGDLLKDLYTKIVDNGGAICKNGLHELFKVDYKNYTIKWNESLDKTKFQFAAVLSKELLRTPKYLEAVALGWPCLSWRFVEDCIRAGELLDASIYLLSAGMSERLDNTAKSHDILQFEKKREDGANLYEQFEHRRMIMARLNVPLYCVDRVSGAAEIVKLLLMIMGAPTIKSIRPSQEVPNGVIVVDPSIKSEEDANSVNDTRRARSYTPYLNFNEVISNSQDGRLPNTVYYNREWVIQCVINGRIV